jgi:hypothetical protein
MANMTFAASVVAELFERQFGNFINHLNYGMEVLDLFEMSKATRVKAQTSLRLAA